MKPRAIFAKKVVTPIGKEYKQGKDMNSLIVYENVYIVYNEKILDITKEAPGVNVQAQANLVTPGFIDCHTHIPFYGFRSKEFVMRSQGAKYVDILKAGGGIHYTVSEVRKVSENVLAAFNIPFIREMIKRGVTRIEGKSGYGLDVENELKQLKALKEISEKISAGITPTFLGAHAVPKGKSQEEYLNELTENFDKFKECADFVDIFVDDGAYSVENARWYLNKAREAGFKIRLHADEIARTGAAALGVELGAVSVDHLLKINDEDIHLIASSETVAVMMPSTSFYLGEEYAPARKLINAGAIVALGSDFNPGSNTINDPTFVFHLAVSKLKMTPEEALTAFTLNSAYVLGVSESEGSIEVGKAANFVAWKIQELEDIPYLPAHDSVDFTVVKGGMIKND
ncbi:MAG: imidazolonepropionase [Thermotogaceae bacterium]|nr:imidazolonepropionase [Thermotogaceae bacterium]